MKKVSQKWLMWGAKLVAAIVGIGIGELFIMGTFLDASILGILPETLHTLIGWIVIIVAVLGLFVDEK